MIRRQIVRRGAQGGIGLNDVDRRRTFFIFQSNGSVVLDLWCNHAQLTGMSGPQKYADVAHADGLAVGICQQRRIGKRVCLLPVAEPILEMSELDKVEGPSLELGRGYGRGFF